ncbi:hypothetical protein CH272_18825 [Rhodococcus sp. 05-340-1]|nr:hypothetical protein CH254_13975 [Rhodococcus sp. 06-412-2C]OZC96503.1 hypothetical protein CH279_14145 [Rhodococcus sp. 06-412-2B]OZD65448.1 hypothetical protein CH271_19965 [Rhodococcus sp. 05-340-2]OZD74686.1 hypothetical protein CH272_18825 [Rhodococcus sp. 05-340-1]OZD86736.1 hypothetical protein CH273_00200 [Rhodococcus sp. 05-339-2]
MSAIGYFPWNSTAERGQSLCVRDDSGALTYNDFATRVDACAAQLADRGVTRGDVVAVMLSNRAELLITLMAAWRAIQSQ